MGVYDVADAPGRTSKKVQHLARTEPGQVVEFPRHWRDSLASVDRGFYEATSLLRVFVSDEVDVSEGAGLSALPADIDVLAADVLLRSARENSRAACSRRAVCLMDLRLSVEPVLDPCAA